MELREASLEVKIAKELWEDDSGRLRLKRGEGLQVRILQGLRLREAGLGAGYTGKSITDLTRCQLLIFMVLR